MTGAKVSDVEFVPGPVPDSPHDTTKESEVAVPVKTDAATDGKPTEANEVAEPAAVTEADQLVLEEAAADLENKNDTGETDD
jgi:hypothetical protein